MGQALVLIADICLFYFGIICIEHMWKRLSHSMVLMTWFPKHASRSAAAVTMSDWNAESYQVHNNLHWVLRKQLQFDLLSLKFDKKVTRIGTISFHLKYYLSNISRCKIRQNLVIQKTFNRSNWEEVSKWIFF